MQWREVCRTDHGGGYLISGHFARNPAVEGRSAVRARSPLLWLEVSEVRILRHVVWFPLRRRGCKVEESKRSARQSRNCVASLGLDRNTEGNELVRVSRRVYTVAVIAPRLSPVADSKRPSIEGERLYYKRRAR